MTMSITNRVISYFFLFDFYHGKGFSDEIDVVPESIIYFYPLKEDLMRQKLLDCGELVGLINCFKYDLFLSIPKEFNFKNSLVTCEHFGRHCAFLVLPKDRFTSDEANIHLTRILQLFHMLYGTLNHIQSIYLNTNQIKVYLKLTLTPILEYVFNENRSIPNLLSAIDYAPIRKNDRCCLLQIRHLLNHLRATYGIKDGLFAYEKQVLNSTFDINTTFYLQVILGLEQSLPANEIYVPLSSETKLKNGVSLMRIYIRRPPSLQPILNAVNSRTTHHSPPQTSSDPINIFNPLLINNNETPSLHFHSTGLSYSLSTSDRRGYKSMIQEDPAGSSGEITDFDTDQTGDISPSIKTEPSSDASSINDKKSSPLSLKDESRSTLSSNLYSRSLTDDQKGKFRDEQSRHMISDVESRKPPTPDRESSFSDDSIQKIILEPIKKDASMNDCDEDDMICLPPVSLFSNFHRARQRTITSHSDLNDGEYIPPGHYEGHPKWGDTPERNDEIERDQLILYIQRNSRMTFAGLMENNSLTDEYLQKLWYFMVNEMANMDREIQIIPTAREINKHNTDVKFQFNENTCQVQFERLSDVNRSYPKSPSADSVSMAFTGRTKLNQNHERKMIGFSRGNNLISINRNLPDRTTYFCRRFQEPQ